MTSLPRRTEVAVVGAGQAGLTMSWHLQQAGREHALLDGRSVLGGGWLDRWEEFRLVGPNWTAGFPGAPYDGDDPDGFMPRDEIAERVARYATTIGAPVVLEAGVDRIRATDRGFLLGTMQGPVEAGAVVVATGAFNLPNIPSLAAALPSRVLSLHSHHYRRAVDLPPGAVLVVGSGQTGVQLAEELLAAGRDVFLAVGSAGRIPRTYRGRDIFYWLWQLAEHGEEVGVALPTAAALADPRGRLAATPQLSGHGGGHETDLRALARSGITLTGRLAAIEGERASLAPDLADSLAAADRFFDERFRDLFDAFIEAAGIDCPRPEPRVFSSYVPPTVGALDLAGAGVSTVLWATGYRPNLRWIDLPVTDELGLPIQDRGVSEIPGLFFIGSLWLHDQASATLVGLPRDARVLAQRMGLGQVHASG